MQAGTQISCCSFSQLWSWRFKCVQAELLWQVYEGWAELRLHWWGDVLHWLSLLCIDTEYTERGGAGQKNRKIILESVYLCAADLFILRGLFSVAMAADVHIKLPLLFNNNHCYSEWRVGKALSWLSHEHQYVVITADWLGICSSMCSRVLTDYIIMFSHNSCNSRRIFISGAQRLPQTLQ